MSKRKSGISRREALRGMAAGAASAAAPQILLGERRPAAIERPNLLYIMVDDLGYGDLRCYGRPDYHTPALDQMAREGVRLTDAYSNGTYCTPTRLALMTGRYQQRVGGALEGPIGFGDTKTGIAPEIPTIASLLQAAGYDTALVGKWHLGVQPEQGPNRHGFAEYFGMLYGGVDYFHHTDDSGRPDLHENLRPAKHEGYITDLLTDRAIEFITRRRARPFYLSLHYNAPHWPWQGPSDRTPTPLTGDDFRGGGSMKIYAEMVVRLDLGIGRVLETLRLAGLAEKTLVIFTSDNGGERFSYNWPFSGGKGNYNEGGIRVPAIVWWPGTVAAGRTSTQTAITMDWHVTLLTAAGVKSDPNYPPDGVDLLPVVRGARKEFDRTLCWRDPYRDAVRRGNWKYLRDKETEGLFDLSADPGEKADLKAKRPSILADLKSEYRRWESQMMRRPKPDEVLF